MVPPPARALAWIHSQELASGGIRVTSDREDAYPEVAGYLVPTLLRYGESEAGARFLRWLSAVQQPDGSFLSPEGLSYVFDTAQALRGFLAGMGIYKPARECAHRAAEYVYGQLLDEGRSGFAKRFWYGIPESVQLYALPPLQRASSLFENAEYRVAVENCLRYYLQDRKALRLETLTHFLGYELEALLDLGKAKVVAATLSLLEKDQRSDGSVAGARGVPWVCAPGLAQLASCWYRIGRWSAGDRAMEWLDERQEPSGGFLGSYGDRASYFPDVEVPWAAKFYLDANLSRVQAFFSRTVVVVPRTVHPTDFRAQTVLTSIAPHTRVLDVGTGKGRYLRLVGGLYPDVDRIGVDLSQEALKSAPRGVSSVLGAMELLPFRAGSFDLVFAVEAVEHSSNLRASIREMVRVSRPGGFIVVVDKEASRARDLDCPPWEHWPAAEELASMLRLECDAVWMNACPSDDPIEPDPPMFVWKGRKRGTSPSVTATAASAAIAAETDKAGPRSVERDERRF